MSQKRKRSEVRAIFVCLFKWIHLTLTVGVIITIIGIRVLQLDAKARHDS